MLIIESISATSRLLQSLVIFKGKQLQSTWFPSESVPNWLYTTLENGWTSHNIGIEWLRQIYIPELAPALDQYWLLIVDGHGSHVDIEFMWLCKQHQIHILCLPAHTSHILQPLDLAPFSVLKSRYRARITALSAINDAAPVKKERFIKAYTKAQLAGFTILVIQAGWRAAGIYPYNPDRVLLLLQISGRPITPPAAGQAPYILDSIFRTPQRPQDLYQAQGLLH